MAKFLHAISLLAAGALVASCGGDDGGKQDSPTTTAKAPAAKTISPADRAEAEKYFKNLCVSCHGESGKGDGPSGAALNPKPRDWTDAKWQSEVKDEDLHKTILNGGTAVGLSALMPPSPQYKTRPGVIDALVEKVRSYRK